MGRILAVDYGTAKLGFAISDETKTIAGKLPQFFIKNKDEAIEAILLVLKSNVDTEKVLFGLPIGIDYKPTQMSEEVKKFVEKLRPQVPDNVEISFTFEVLSTKQAEQGKKKRFKQEKSDSEAARIFLQEYLDHINMNKER